MGSYIFNVYLGIDVLQVPQSFLILNAVTFFAEFLIGWTTWKQSDLVSNAFCYVFLDIEIFLFDHWTNIFFPALSPPLARSLCFSFRWRMCPRALSALLPSWSASGLATRHRSTHGSRSFASHFRALAGLRWDRKKYDSVSLSLSLSLFLSLSLPLFLFLLLSSSPFSYSLSSLVCSASLVYPLDYLSLRLSIFLPHNYLLVIVSSIGSTASTVFSSSQRKQSGVCCKWFTLLWREM